MAGALGGTAGLGAMTVSVQLQHSYKDFSLDISFEAPIGVTALVGPSGSGKTTVVNAVAGLLSPDQGRIQIGDRVVFDRGRGIDLAPPRRRIGYVFQDARLFPHLNVKQNLLYGRWFRPQVVGADFNKVVDILGIAPLLKRRTTDLSGGEKQRVAIGRALLSNPELLLMDEPLAALDPARKAEIIPYLMRLRDEIRLPILYISHSEAEISALANIVVMIESGKIRGLRKNSSIIGGNMTDQGLLGCLTLAGTMVPARDGHAAMFSTEAGTIEIANGASLTANSIVIAPRDLILSVTVPTGVAARGILTAQIEAIDPTRATDTVQVLLRVANARVALNLTLGVVQRLGLQAGQGVHLIVTEAQLQQG